jgi:PAS domain S-box-containing protein
MYGGRAQPQRAWRLRILRAETWDGRLIESAEENFSQQRERAKKEHLQETLRSEAVTATEVRLGTIRGRAIRNGRSPSVYRGNARDLSYGALGNFQVTARPALAVVLRYGLAVASVATALGTTLILRHYGFPPRFISHFTLIAIAITFWCAGTGPGLLALLLSGLGVSLLARNQFLLPGFPLESFLILYVTFSLLMGWFSASRRHAEQLLTEARDNLEHRVAERTGELVRANSELEDTQVALRSREAYLAQAQRLSQTGSFGWRPSTGEILWSQETFRIFEYDRTTKPTVELVLLRVHPEDTALVKETIERASQDGKDFDVEHRLLMPDGPVKYVRIVAHALRDESGSIEFVGAVTDITAAKQAEDKIRQNERELRQILECAPKWVAVLGPDRSPLYANQAVLDYFGATLEDWRGADRQKYYHPDDWERLNSQTQSKFLSGLPHEYEARFLGKDGKYRWFLFRWSPLRDEQGRVTRWYAAATDIEERKQAEEVLRESEKSVRLIVDSIAGLVAMMTPEGEVEFVNNRVLEYFGKTLEELKGWATSDAVHPDDLPQAVAAWIHSVETGDTFDLDERLRGSDGTYRWFHIRGLPLRDTEGRIVRWYNLLTDIDERKRAEEKLYDENVALRDEIDQASMFEEIVGSSKALRKVLSQVARVAETDSTVLILGETGTGKELIARAIHNRSNRSTRAFVRINCAAVPTSLIASELFGHEKGAFTGAVQRRVGRFELAHGGTIFLDEIGELPPETQITLLRVLQEREFERVGGGQPISVDVRVLAAANRDLNGAIAAGTFRQDLFYRLNVFPIQIPGLRERRDDIPILLEYFIERYAKKAGKRIRTISKNTLELFQAYDWPGNIRELQNVVERAVVLCDGEMFSVDETWLKRKLPRESPLSIPASALGRLDADQEKRIIEAALAETGGRIAGPSGAAAKLGIPRQTLDSKISTLGIDKRRFKSA